MFRGKDRLDTKEKVRQTGHKGKGETGWTQKVRQGKVKLTGCGKIFPVKGGLDTKEKARQ